MISKRSIILTAIAILAPLLAVSWVNWLGSAVWLEHHPMPHEVTGSTYSLDSAWVWTGPTLSQKVLAIIGVAAGILALWSLVRDAKCRRPRLYTDAPRFGGSRRRWDRMLADLVHGRHQHPE